MYKALDLRLDAFGMLQDFRISYAQHPDTRTNTSKCFIRTFHSTYHVLKGRGPEPIGALFRRIWQERSFVPLRCG